MEHNYKIIKLDLKEPLSAAELEILEILNKKFSPQDIFFEHTSDQLLLYLNKLDLDSLKQTLQELKSRYHVTETIFRRVLRKIEAIKSYGVKGGKRIYVDYDKERKVRHRKQKEITRGAYFYVKPETFSTSNNELPAKYVNQIICGDSEIILKELPENCVDLIFTSPPYNFGLDYDTTADGISWEKYFAKLFAIFTECIRVLKFGGRIVVNVQPLFSDYIPSHHLISNFFMEQNLIWKGEILWEKHNYNCKYTAWGSWKSPSNPYLKYTWEFLEVFAKGTLKKEGKLENIDIKAEEFKKWVVARWSISPERKMEQYCHPAMFPEELAYRVIKLFSYKNDVVMDPFNGTGTTTAVAWKTGRRYLGIDISPDYCETARRRLLESKI